MVGYVFEIQNCIKVKVEANSKEKARMVVINKLHNGDYDDEMVEDAYVSDGEELKGGEVLDKNVCCVCNELKDCFMNGGWICESCHERRKTKKNRVMKANE